MKVVQVDVSNRAEKKRGVKDGQKTRMGSKDITRWQRIQRNKGFSILVGAFSKSMLLKDVRLKAIGH